MKVGIGGILDLSREYHTKLFGSLFYSWWNGPLMQDSITALIQIFSPGHCPQSQTNVHLILLNAYGRIPRRVFIIAYKSSENEADGYKLSPRLSVLI